MLAKILPKIAHCMCFLHVSTCSRRDKPEPKTASGNVFDVSVDDIIVSIVSNAPMKKRTLCQQINNSLRGVHALHLHARIHIESLQKPIFMNTMGFRKHDACAGCGCGT